MRMPRLEPYPFLLAAYSVLGLAASNSGEIPGLWVLARPLGISLLVALCAWLLLGALAKDPDRRAFFTFITVTLFASYGYFTTALSQVAWAAPYAHTALPLLIMTAYLAAVTYLVFRLVTNSRALTRFLTTFTAVLVLWAGLNVLRDATGRTVVNPESSAAQAAPISVHASKGSPPDIYLIVLDKYTGSQSLRENFGFDNGDFEAFLAEHGFVLPRSAQANYIYTFLSLAALLNYRYLDELASESLGVNRAKAYINRLVEDNAVWRFLQPRGYRFIFFPTEFPVTGRNRFADLQLPDPREILSEFEIAWRRTTLAEPMLSWICEQISCIGPISSEAKLLEWKFEQLSQLPRWPRDGRPLFIFAHLTTPHEPYIFNANCSLRPPFWPSYYVVADETPEKQAYVAQIQCLNRRLRSIVEHLIRDSPSPPVIILQSDHGHGRMPLHIPDLDAVTPDRVAERADVFAAYYLPGAMTGKIVYDSISPVNVFRTVFRQYFQAQISLLPDKTYWSPGSDPFRFTRVSHGRRWPE
jgi:hypothetical protein